METGIFLARDFGEEVVRVKEEVLEVFVCQ
jgi:hypothetical protein